MQLKEKVISFFRGAKKAKHKPPRTMIYSLFMYITSPEGLDWKFMEAHFLGKLFESTKDFPYFSVGSLCYFQH